MERERERWREKARKLCGQRATAGCLWFKKFNKVKNYLNTGILLGAFGACPPWNKVQTRNRPNRTSRRPAVEQSLAVCGFLEASEVFDTNVSLMHPDSKQPSVGMYVNGPAFLASDLIFFTEFHLNSIVKLPPFGVVWPFRLYGFCYFHKERHTHTARPMRRRHADELCSGTELIRINKPYSSGQAKTGNQ